MLSRFNALKGGLENPDWYYNLLAHSEAMVEVGTEQFKVHATFPAKEGSDQLYAQFAQIAPVFQEYEKNASRVIPVVILKKS